MKKFIISLFISLPLLAACNVTDTQSRSSDTNSSTQLTTQKETSPTSDESTTEKSTTNDTTVTNQTSSQTEVPEDVTKIINALEPTIAPETIKSIKIYTPNYSEHKKIYIIEAISSNEQISHAIYIENADKLVSIEENEYLGKRQGIIKQNKSETPYYEADDLDY